MNTDKHREEHANTLLAQILRGLGIDAKAETVGHRGRKIPDMHVAVGGFQIILEAEYDSRKGAAADADKRLQEADIVGAISYPPIFKNDFAAAIETGARIGFAFKKSEEGAGGWRLL